jgi:putative phosphoribosyl transferase
VIFRDRTDAGRQLAVSLAGYRHAHPVVLGLPRGGVVVAYEIARALDAPLDVLCVRKIGVPGHEELGMGAVSEGAAVYLDPAAVTRVGLPPDRLAALVSTKANEVELRRQLFAHGRHPLPLEGRTAILVDDGIATGGTARAAAIAARRRNPRALVLAAPVSAPQTLIELRSYFDDIICLATPEDLFAVGQWFDEFGQVEDDEVTTILDLARLERMQRDTAPVDGPDS